MPPPTAAEQAALQDALNADPPPDVPEDGGTDTLHYSLRTCRSNQVQASSFVCVEQLETVNDFGFLTHENLDTSPNDSLN